MAVAQGTYPPLLAAGITNLGRFDQFDLYAGESDIVTSQAQAADGQAISQFQVLSYDVNGRLVPWDASEFGYASGTLTFTGAPANNETFAINGVTITAKTSGAVAANGEFNIGADATANATAVAALINGTPDAADVNTSYPTYGNAPLAGTGVTATSAAGVVTFHAIAPGTAGNSITLTESLSNATVSGAGTLTGGAAESDVQAKIAVAIAAQPVDAATPGNWVPIFIGGVFNHEALVWPAAVGTLAQRKRAFAGTDISVAQLL